MPRIVAALLLLSVVGTTACVSLPPVHPRALENTELCAQQIAANDLQRAEVYCDLALQFSPNYADPWSNKGLIYLKQGQLDKAKDAFLTALRHNEEHAQAYNNLGYIYYKQSECGKAHDRFQRALKVNPDYAEARFNLALAFICRKEPDKAKKELRTLIEVFPNLADPQFYMGSLALDEGNLEQAVTYLETAVRLDPNYADAWMNLGKAYAEWGKFADAREAYGHCIRVDAGNIQCRQALPLVNRKFQLQDPALQEIEARAEADNAPAAQMGRAKQYQSKGLRHEEKQAYKKCLQLDGRYAPCHFGLFELYFEDRQDNDATSACKNFLRYVVAEDFPKEVEKCEKYLSLKAR